MAFALLELLIAPRGLFHLDSLGLQAGVLFLDPLLQFPALLVRGFLRVLEETHRFRFQLRGLLFPRIDQAGLGFELLRASADFRLRAVDRLSRLTVFTTLCTEALFRGAETLLDPIEFRFALV